MGTLVQLKGRPVLVMRRGIYPNKSEVQDIIRSYPIDRFIVMVEPLTPARFAITVRSKS